MKQHLLTVFVLSLLLAACRHDTTPVESAAMELYRSYADNEQGITVAYIGDYRAYDQVFNAVMFQADDSAQWQWLKHEFGIIEPIDLQPDIFVNRNKEYSKQPVEQEKNRIKDNTEAKNGVTMISVHIDTSIHFNSKEQQQRYIDSLTKQIISQISEQSTFSDTGINVASVLASDTTLDQQLRQQISQQCKLAEYSKKDNKIDFLLKADLANRVVLCFFCDTQDDAATLARWLNRNTENL